MNDGASAGALKVLAAAVVVIATAVWLRRRRKNALETATSASEAIPAVTAADSVTPGESAIDASGAAAPEDDQLLEERLAELFEDVKKRSKGICMAVSNKTNSAFSAKSLVTYLKKQGLSPNSGTALVDVAANAELLVELLQRNGDSCRSSASTMRHAVTREGISPAKLLELFPAMKTAYRQQPLDYGRNSRYGDKWRISCYLVVMENWKPKILPHQPMVDCMAEVMDECVRLFENWYCDYKKLSSTRASVMNAFVTRYRPVLEEDQLQKHIDGANVDGSVILALPTDDPCEGGQLHVWDGKPQKELSYLMQPGDIMFLDNAVWHQAKPITSGTRWALVLFLRLHPGPARS